MYDARRFFSSCLRSAMQNSDLKCFSQKRRGHAETWIRNPSAQNFLINKVVLSIYMQKYLLLFPFSPQIVKSILAFLSFKYDVMARSTRCYF